MGTETHRTTFCSRRTTSDIRAYLNGEFFNSFSAADRARIRETYVINNDNPWPPYEFGISELTPGGNNTRDRIFLLSIEEVVRYFGDSGQLANRSHYTESRIMDEFDLARIALSNEGSASMWWLRSPGFDSYRAAGIGDVSITSYGVISLGGNGVWESNRGVRPALWLCLES